MTEKLHKIIYSVVAFIYVSLINKVPVSIYSNAIHDDALFISRAQDIVAGNWAGSAYNQFILAKGLGFSLFEAFNYSIGLPITLTIGLVNIAMAFFLKNTIEKFYKNEYFSMVFFICILFSPVLIPERIIRDNIYFSLTIFSIIGFLRLLLKIDISRNLSIFYGSIFGIFWITREEGVWVFPALFFSVLIIVKINGLNYFKCIYKNLLSYIASALLIIISISLINGIKYGIYSTNDIKEANFQSALNSLYSVNVGEPVPYLPVSKSQRDIVYSISPTFNELRNYFEGQGMDWTGYGCAEYPQTCGDYAGGWFIWSLRDAAASVGAYTTPSKAKSFYRAISDEITAACNSKSISCNKRYFEMLPPMANSQWEKMPSSLLSGFKRLLYFNETQQFSDSTGPSGKIYEYTNFLGRPLIKYSNLDKPIFISGWLQAKNNQWFRLECANKNGLISIYPTRNKSPDILINGLNQKDVRFSFSINKNDECKIVMDDDSGYFKINENLNLPGMREIGSKNLFQFDNIDLINTGSVSSISTVNIFNLYKFLVPIVVMIGIFCFIYNLFSKNIKNKKLRVFEISIWFLICSRLILLSLVDISAFHSMNNLYLGPLFIAIIFVSFLSIANNIEIFKRVIKR